MNTTETPEPTVQSTDTPIPNASVTTQGGNSNVLMLFVYALAFIVFVMMGFWAMQQIARLEASIAVKGRIGVIDVEQALSQSRTTYLDLLSKDSPTDEQRQKAAELINASTKQIDQAVAQITQECQCVLLLRPAVLQAQHSGLVDYTDRLLELVAISKP